MACGIIKEEFKNKKIFLKSTRSPSNFLAKSWILPLWAFLVLRTMIALFCVVIIITSGVRAADPVWFIYLTNWSFFFVTCSAVCLLSVTAIHMFNPTAETGYNMDSPDLKETMWYEKIAWFFWTVASNSAIIVTLLYWSLVFTPPTYFKDIAVHALNFVVVLLEIYLGMTPVHILHFIYPAFFAGAYSIFVVIFWAADGKNSRGQPYIYKPVDLNDNTATAVVMLLITTFLICPLIQLVLFGLYQIRVFITKKIIRKDENCEDFALQKV